MAKMGSKGTPGATGENGKTSYIHTAYSWSSDGTDRFTTEYPKENLWVVKDLVPGYINSTTGEVVPPGATLNERATEFLKIGNNKKITVNYTVNLPINGYYWCGIGCYDADKAFISRTGFSGTPATEPGEQNKTQTFSLNPKTEYIRVSFRTYDSSVIKVEESDHLTIYTPSPVDDYDNAYPKFSGTYTDYTEIDSEDPAKYTWSRFLGEIGPDGKTTYFHQAWANSEDGKDSFSTTQSIGKKYIGTYSDQEETSSQDPTKYQWTELVGAIEHDNRNLLVGTKEFSSTYFVNNNATLTSDYYQGARIYKTTVDWGAYRYRIRDLLSREQMGIGQTYCYSCWVKYVPDTTTPNNTIYLGIYGIQEAQENGELIGEVSGKDGWVRIQVPFTLKALPSETGILRIEPSNITEKKGTLYVCGPKLEKGRWPTDWCEAPEDIEQKVESIESTIDTIDKDIETVQNGLSNLAAKASIDVGMKVGYSDFNTANATSIFFCGYKKDPSTFDETLANIDGSIRNWENNTLITVPKQQLNLSGITNKTGYIVYDHTKKLIWFVDYTTDEKWIQYNVGQTGTGTTMTFTESHYVLGEIEI
ncbi:hypothetical protein I4L69_001651 [Enterococcus faecium]|nr:hypothetical protein [Enterococcus faecium]